MPFPSSFTAVRNELLHYLAVNFSKDVKADLLSLKEKQAALTAHRIISMTYPLFYKPAPWRAITFGGAYRKRQVTERKIILTNSTDHHYLTLFSLGRICFVLRRRVESIRTVIIIFPKYLNNEQKRLQWPITILGCRRTDVTSWLFQRL